jgi:hypothetical protein
MPDAFIEDAFRGWDDSLRDAPAKLVEACS